jgi:dTDP-4-amino-4,6-dideoxygalactose transaminase
VAEAAFERILTLPLHPGLTLGDVDLVCDTIKLFYQKAS